MAKLKYEESTTRLGTRERDAARKLTLKVDILQVFTIDFSEIEFIVNHNQLAKEDRTYHSRGKRYQGQRYLTLNKESKNGPMKIRSDYRAAVLTKNRLHHELGEPIEEPIHPSQQSRIRQGQEVFSKDYFSSARVDQHTGWQYWPSSTSSSWWYASEWSWK